MNPTYNKLDPNTLEIIEPAPVMPPTVTTVTYDELLARLAQAEQERVDNIVVMDARIADIKALIQEADNQGITKV